MNYFTRIFQRFWQKFQNTRFASGCKWLICLFGSSFLQWLKPFFCRFTCQFSHKHFYVEVSFDFRAECMDHFYCQENPSLHKKWSFPLRFSSVNVTKSAGNWRKYLLKKTLTENFIFWTVLYLKCNQNSYSFLTLSIFLNNHFDS